MNGISQIDKSRTAGIVLSLAGLTLTGCDTREYWSLTPTKHVTGRIEKILEPSELISSVSSGKYSSRIHSNMVMAVAVRLEDGSVVKLELYDSERWDMPDERGPVTVSNLALVLEVGVSISFPTEMIYSHPRSEETTNCLVNPDGFGRVDVDFVKIVSTP